MPMSPDTVRGFLLEAFPDALIELEDTAGDNDHYRAVVVTRAFEGLNRVARGRLCNAAFKGQLGTVLHSITFETKTPEEVA
jgi:stress-induced morphogen